MALVSRYHRRDKKSWIKALIKPVNPPIEVWSRNPSGCANLGNYLSLNNRFSNFDQNFTQMEKAGRQPIAMINNQGCPGKEHPRMGQSNNPTCRSFNRRPFGGGDIDTEMGATGFTIQNPLTSVKAKKGVKSAFDSRRLLEIVPGPHYLFSRSLNKIIALDKNLAAG